MLWLLSIADTTGCGLRASLDLMLPLRSPLNSANRVGLFGDAVYIYAAIEFEAPRSYWAGKIILTKRILSC
jgi:hypothetical protein